MKKVILILAILAMAITPAMAAEVTFQWDANTETDLAGYRIYEGTVSGDHPNQIAEIPCAANDTACATYLYQDVTDGTYYWVATAYDKDGNESEKSIEVSLTIDTVAPGSPQNFRVTITEARSVSVSVD